MQRRECQELSGWAGARLSWDNCSNYVAVFSHVCVCVCACARARVASGGMTCASLHVNSWAIHLQVNLQRAIPVLAPRQGCVFMTR